MSNTVVNREVIFIYDFHRLLALFVRLSNEYYTFYGLVVTIPKQVPILGAETRVDFTSRCVRTPEKATTYKTANPVTRSKIEDKSGTVVYPSVGER